MNKFRLKTGIVLSIIAFAIIACKKDNPIGGSDANFKPSEVFDISFTDDSHLTAKFTDASKDPGSYYWDFGDGTSSTEQNPTHTYKDIGTTKQYTITRVVISKAGHRDTLQDDIKVYSATPKIDKVEYCRGKSYNGEYKIALSTNWRYAKKVDFYLKKNNVDSLLYSINPYDYSGGSVPYDINTSPLKIGSFDEATVNQAYKLKIVYTGSTGITKDTTVDVVPTITNIIIEKVSVTSTPIEWATVNPLNLATTKDELDQVDPAKTKKTAPFVWDLNTMYTYNDAYKKIIYRLNEENGTATDPDHSNVLDYANLPLPDQTGIPGSAVLLRQYNPTILVNSYAGVGPIIVQFSYHYE